MTPRMAGPSLADKRTVGESKPTRMAAGDVLEDLDFELCRNAPCVFLSHLDEGVCWVNRCRADSEMIIKPC